MKKEFVGKTLCLIGDSILEHGFYTYNLRSYFQNAKEKCYVFNRGVAGNRAIMAQYILEDEVFWLNPDYAVICFGANDLGIWLYDSLKPVTEEVLQKRKLRDDEYIKAHEILIDKLSEKGIKPIIMSPYSMNSLLVENDDIETITDNDEKEDEIKPSFYKRKTFENINQAFKGYAQRLKELCERKGVIFWDMFKRTHEIMLVEDGLFFDDGCHYSKEKGHAVLAKIILEFLGCEPPVAFDKTPENDKIFELEQLERSTGYITRCTPMNPIFGNYTEEDIVNYAKKILDDESAYSGSRRSAKNYLERRHQLPEMKQELVRLVKSL